VIVVTPDTPGNVMNVTTDRDERALVANFISYANINTFDNIGVDLTGYCFVVQGIDNNAYIFNVPVDGGFTGYGMVDNSDPIQLIGVLTGVKTADLVTGNFLL